MGEFQDMKPIDGLELSSVSADLYDNGRDDLLYFILKMELATSLMNTANSIISETLLWNQKSNKKN